MVWRDVDLQVQFQLHHAKASMQIRFGWCDVVCRCLCALLVFGVGSMFDRHRLVMRFGPFGLMVEVGCWLLGRGRNKVKGIT
jgi:hypothetical protein